MRPLAPPALLALALAAGCGGGDEPARHVAAPPSLSCDQVILKVRSGTQDGYRVILDGAVSVPPAYLSQTFATRDRDWPFWEKAGLVVHAGRGPVDVSVPESWRDRAAVGWGNPAHPMSSLRIAACPGRGWNAYAGGFFLERRSGCVPVDFRIGDRHTTVTFGLRKKRCRQP